MFRCTLCGACSKARKKQIEVITHTRKKTYPRRMKVNSGYKEKGSQRVRSKSKSDRLDDHGGEGWEIAAAAKVIGCDHCTANGKPCPGKLPV